jgi:3-hydroxyacyl-[acyl-carrier-protein] dehydratase
MSSYQDLPLEEKFSRILSLVPQQKPFRFVDRIIEVDEQRIVGQYTFREDEWFYRGHFPGNPVTPGVVLVECMAQIGLVAFAMHLKLSAGLDPSEYVTLFQETQVEFLKTVLPGDTVTVKAEQIYWRRGKLKAKIDLYLPGEVLAASGTMAGMGVKSNNA